MQQQQQRSSSNSSARRRTSTRHNVEAPIAVESERREPAAAVRDERAAGQAGHFGSAARDEGPATARRARRAEAAVVRLGCSIRSVSVESRAAAGDGASSNIRAL